MRLGRLFIIRPDVTLASVFIDVSAKKKYIITIESEHLQFTYLPKDQKFKRVKEKYDNFFCDQSAIESLVNNANLSSVYVPNSFIMDCDEFIMVLN